MKRLMTIRDLKKLLRENLSDVEVPTGTYVPVKSEDSLDTQIDKFFMQYENEAQNLKKEGRDFRMLARRILSEADEEEDTSDDSGDEEMPADNANKLTLENIDINSFTNSVIRLVENYDNLLEVKNTIIRRAINFIDKSYAPDVIMAFEQTLREEHGIVPGKTEKEVFDDEFQAPAADRAGDGGAGPGGAA